MGILHELLIVVGVVLLLVIGWSVSLTVRETLQAPGITMNVARPAHACRGNVCRLDERG